MNRFYQCRVKGTIVGYDDNVPSYAVKWEDRTIEGIVDMTRVDTMVQNAKKNANTNPTNHTTTTSTTSTTTTSTTNTTAAAVPTSTANDDPVDDLSNYESFALSTPVLLEFVDGWYEGKITDFTKPNSTYAFYEVTWSDGEVLIYDDLDYVNEMVANAREYDPWKVGTAVYNDDSSLFGKIGVFVDGHYTIEWEDEHVENFFDFDTVDDFVSAARSQNTNKDGSTSGVDNQDTDDYLPWEDGTSVFWEFDDGWWEGNILGFDQNSKTYEIQWSDGTINYYSDLVMVDQMVVNAEVTVNDDHTDDAADDDYAFGYDDDETLYEIGTKVYKEFDDGWWVGNIVSYEDGYYSVRWEDNSYEYYEIGTKEVDQMVADADNIPNDLDSALYAIGTPVYAEFDEGWYHGTIESYHLAMYTVRWEDGAKSEYVEGSLLDEIVANAAYLSSNDDGMSTVGKVLLSMSLLGLVALFATVAVNKARQRNKMVSEQVNASGQEIVRFDQKCIGYVY
jgi:hypothetical protein